MQIGVFSHKSVIDLSGVSDYLRGKIEEYKEKAKNKGARRVGLTRRHLEARISTLEECLANVDKSRREGDFFDNLAMALSHFSAYIDECRQDMGGLLPKVDTKRRLFPSTLLARRFQRELGRVFSSHLLRDVRDVVLIEKERLDGGKWLFDVLTIKESGLSVFKNDLKCIPSLGIKSLKERQQFSQRYVFRPYPWAVQLWLQDESSIIVPDDLKSFLQGAIRYFFSSEWRTSIVLSAICVESMLADLFEEEQQEPAPDTPLGDLFRQVGEKIDFPPDITRAIHMVNEARIAAVHRSRFPVSDREAINAMSGAANFAIWYS